MGSAGRWRSAPVSPAPRSRRSISTPPRSTNCARRSPSIATQVVDVVDRAAFAAAARQIGRIDGVVNNAMLIRYDPIEAVDEATLDRMLAIGIKGAVWGVQALLRHMDPAAGGVVLNHGLAHGRARHSDHRRLQHGQGRDGHSDANAWPPNSGRDACASTLWRPARSRHRGRSRSRRRRNTSDARRALPLRRLGREDDATSASLYLLSDAASFVSGEILHVDGGFLASI